MLFFIVCNTYLSYVKYMTDRQKKFIQFYDGNATKAAIKAGYSKKTARSIGQELLTKPDISKAISKRNTKQDAPMIMSRIQRQEFWSAIANDTKVYISDRLRASELLGKSEADFTDKHEHAVTVNVLGTIKINGKPYVFNT
jgi:phage terminase small subunit